MSLFLSSKKGVGSFFNYVPTPVRQWILLVGVFILKNEKLLELVKVAKLFKASNAVLSSFSVLVSIGFYSIDKGSAFALSFFGALLIHEVGHITAIAFKKLGNFWETLFSMRAFPGIGAMIQAPPMASREEEAYIGYAGPLFSVVASGIFLGLWFITPNILLTGLHHTFLAFAILFGIFLLFHLTQLKGEPINRTVFSDAVSWNDVFHQFFAISLVRKICAHAFLGGVSLLIWLFSKHVVVSAPDFVFMTAFVSLVIGAFNLIITIRPLDGGRVLQIVGSVFPYVGIAILAIFTIYMAESSFMIIWMIVLVSLRIEPKLRLYVVSIAGIGLLLFMGFGTSHQTPFENIVDILLGLWMFSIAYSRKDEVWHKQGGDRRVVLTPSNSTEERRREDLSDRRKDRVPWSVRIRWLTYYSVLLASAFGIFALMVHFVPVHFSK